MDDCLLTSPDLLALVGKLNAVCVQFANCLNRLADASLDDTLDSVPMSTAASMQHRLGVAAGTVSASPSFTNLALTPVPALLRGDQRRRGSIASSDGGSLFRAGDTTASSLAGSSLDVRRRVSALLRCSLPFRFTSFDKRFNFSHSFTSWLMESWSTCA